MATSKKSSPVNETRKPRRQLKAPKYKTFRMHKRIKSPQAKLPSIWKLWKTAFTQLLSHKRIFIGITLIYALLMLILVRGLSGGLSAYQLKQSIDATVHGTGGKFESSFAVFTVLLGSASSSQGDLGGLYQSLVLIIATLAFIWALRQTQSNSKKKATVKDSFYLGCAPVIPFIVVLFIISLQLFPIAIGNLMYSFVIVGGFAASSIEKALWFIMIGLLFLLSFYMISSSIFALFIVTLPDTRPMQALRAARELVRYRRWAVLRKVIVLPIVLFLLLALVTLPSLLIIPYVAEWIFFIATMLVLPVLLSYMYALYRAML